MANRSAPRGTIIPCLIYDDVAQAIDWLCDVFGFQERLRVAGGDGKVGHAQLAIGRGIDQGGVMLGASRVGQGRGWSDSAEFRPPRSTDVSQVLLVRVEDVDAHYEHAKQRGARILHPPTTYPYGERQYTAQDLAGHRWSFSQSVADAKPEEWGATVRDIRTPQLARPRWCYLQIPAVDAGRSASFYEKVFGWNIKGGDSDHPRFDDATGQVSGSWVTGRGIAREPGLLPYIWVDDIDATLAQVAAWGGEIIEAPHPDAPGGEWIATFRDPAGNVIGLYQEGPRSGSPINRA
jgi:uncharacterized glyoxalase superfamily protein PhnB